MILNHGGVAYEITNWDEFKHKLLNAIGIEIVQAIEDQIESMRLIGSGGGKGLWGSITFDASSDEVIITSTVPHAIYLEYGTYELGEAFYDSWPTPYIKKKEMTRVQRKNLPRGMAPFAPFRKVLYNDRRMAQIVGDAVKSAT